MKILKNVFKVMVALVVGIETTVIIFFCGFAAGIDFKNNERSNKYRTTYVHYDDGKRRYS